jgi:hypothetical protein
MALSPRRRKELRAYLAKCPGVGCRLTNRHDFPLPMEWGSTDKLKLSRNPNQGSWELEAWCKRDCGMLLTYGIDRSTGIPVKHRSLTATKDDYKWTGGDGFAMTAEERAYLMVLVMEEANARLPFPVAVSS